MTPSLAMEAGRVCSRLAALSLQDPLLGAVHSVFDQAVNVEFGAQRGLIAVVGSQKSLVPYGCVVAAGRPFSALGIRPGAHVALDRTGLAFEGGVSIRLETAARVALSTDSIACDSERTNLRACLQPVLAVLRAGEESQGLSALAACGAENVYTAFLTPRLNALFDAVGRTDASAEPLCARTAGCGPGLTPGSDDLLTGYFLTVRLLSRFGRMKDARTLLTRMAAAAAQKTNRISGTFLLNSGEGLASEDVLALLNAIFTDAPEADILHAAARVASFGSTSGRDTLTGLVLAIQHHDGGKNSGQTGDQEERIL